MGKRLWAVIGVVAAGLVAAAAVFAARTPNGATGEVRGAAGRVRRAVTAALFAQEAGALNLAEVNRR